MIPSEERARARVESAKRKVATLIQLSCTSAGHTDIGVVREHNEDAYAVDDRLGLYVVADGMGGHACGEVASALAIETVTGYLRDRVRRIDQALAADNPRAAVGNLLSDAIRAAGRAIYNAAHEDAAKKGMGTTVVAVLLAAGDAYVAHVGDSRVLLVRDGHGIQLTRDHTIANELVDRGDITPEDARTQQYARYRNTLSRALGLMPEVAVDVAHFEVIPNDVFVLASDGLTHYVTADEIVSLMEDGPESALEAAVSQANKRGGHDNITGVAVRIDAVEEPEEAQETLPADRATEYQQKLAAVEGLPLFRYLDRRQVLRVLNVTTVRTYMPGEALLEEGEDSDAMYLVLSGRVVVKKGGENVTMLGPGSHVGELSLIDRAPRSATVRAMEPSRVLVLQRVQLYELVQHESELSVRLLWSFAESFAERLRATTESLIAALDVGIEEDETFVTNDGPWSGDLDESAGGQ